MFRIIRRRTRIVSRIEHFYRFAVTGPMTFAAKRVPRTYGIFFSYPDIIGAIDIVESYVFFFYEQRLFLKLSYRPLAYKYFIYLNLCLFDMNMVHLVLRY